MRDQAYRRHKAHAKQLRRLKEDRNEHYRDLSCSCFYDPKAIARFRDTPTRCSCSMCGNPRRHLGLHTVQELRAMEAELVDQLWR